MRSKKQSLLVYLLPLLFLVLGVSFTYFSESCFEQTREKLIQFKAHFIETQIAENLRQLIVDKVDLLTTTAETQQRIFPNERSHYNQLAAAIYKNTPGFLAMNWIDPQGYIRWVYPDDEVNAKAKNKKVIDRNDVKEFIKKSHDEHKPQLSNIVNLYQGTKGFILYVPIYSKKGEFRGWLNGVINYKQLLDNFFAHQKFEDTYVKIAWTSDKNSIYEYGVLHGLKPEYFSKFQVLNQSFEVETSLLSDRLTMETNRTLQGIFLFSYFVIILISLLFYKLLKTHFELRHAYSELRRDKTIISILSHDMATPLTLIAENATRLKEKIKNSFPELERIQAAAEKQKDLLKKVRSLHATRLGSIQIDLAPCSLQEIVEEALTNFQELMKNKKISSQITIPKNLPLALADQSTAINNVLENVLSNAIKFSDENTTIVFSAHEEAPHVVLEIKNQGKKITKETIRNIFSNDLPDSLPGTHGESGTGLGMLQIQSFMNYYGGKMDIRTEASGTAVLLYFIKA